MPELLSQPSEIDSAALLGLPMVESNTDKAQGEMHVLVAIREARD